MPGGRPKSRVRPDAVKSVAKVLDILEHLGAARRPVSVSDLARATGFNVSTAFRLVQTLVSRGYVEQQAGHRELRARHARLPARERLPQGQRPRHARAAAPRGAARRGRRDGVPRDPQPGRDRPALQGRRPARGQRLDPVERARAGVLHRDRQGAALRSRARRVPDATSTGVQLRAYTAQTITSQREARARDRRGARGRLRARRRGVRREPVLRQRAGARPGRAARSPPPISVAMPKIRFQRSLVPRWRKLLEEKAALISPPLGLIDPGN